MARVAEYRGRRCRRPGVAGGGSERASARAAPEGNSGRLLPRELRELGHPGSRPMYTRRPPGITARWPGRFPSQSHRAPSRRVGLPVREQLEPIWNRVRDELRREVPDFKFHIWLDPLELAGVRRHVLFVRAPDHIRTWVRDRYLSTVVDAAAQRRSGPMPRWRSSTRSGSADERGRRPGARARRHPSRPEPQVHLRAVRHRPGQPLRPRRGPRGRRAARPGLQPALHPRPPRARQDPPPARDRQLRRPLRRRPARPLRHRRGVHHRVRPRRQGPRHRRLQGALPRRRRAAPRRRPVPGRQGAHRGGALPHLQRPARRPAASS